jgi:hypothetical protein
MKQCNSTKTHINAFCALFGPISQAGKRQQANARYALHAQQLLFACRCFWMCWAMRSWLTSSPQPRELLAVGKLPWERQALQATAASEGHLLMARRAAAVQVELT